MTAVMTPATGAVTPTPAQRRYRIGFRRHLRVVVSPGEATYLLSARGVTALTGPHIEALAPLLDGTRTLSGVLRAAAGEVPPAEAGRLLAWLARENLVGYREAARPDPETDPCLAAAEAAYWEAAGLDGDAARAATAQLPVALQVLGGTDPAQVRAACQRSGLRVVTDPHRAAFSLVICDDYLDPQLRGVDAEHRAAGRPWLLAKPAGVEPWVGPVFRPGAGPCWSCLAHRLREHRRAERPAQRTLGLAGPVPLPDASLDAGRAAGVHLAVVEAAKWLAGLDSSTQDALTTLDTLTFRSERHPIAHRPQCPGCGAPGLVAEQVRRPVTLVSRPKAAAGGANHRALDPQQMLERYRPLVDGVIGVVGELRRDDRLPPELACYLSGQNLAMAAPDLAGVRAGLRSLSGGKGATPVEAEVGALCEAVERYCGTRQGDEPTVRDTLAALGPQAIHPNAVQLFADHQFLERDRWNPTCGPAHQVCAPFDPFAPADWTPVWSLTAGEHQLLPTAILYFDTGGDRGPDEPWADSNGNAAGSSLEDALVQGFLELVERDAVAQWWYNRTRHPALDLDAFDEQWLADLRAAYARLHRQVWALDLTADFGIPAAVCLSRRTDQPAEEITLGFGAHFDPRLALRRAATEMSQLTAPVLDGGGSQPGVAPADPALCAWWSTATLANQPYLRPDPGETGRTPGCFPCAYRADLREDVAAIEALVRAHGMELLVLDQTRPDVGMPVVKVIVPGMRHFWARFAPGRLFDVPVRLGRLGRRTRQEELNPIPLFA